MAEVVTGEAVVLDLAIARFPSRIVAQLIDVAVQIPVLIFVGVVIGAKAAQHLNQASAAAINVLGLVFVVIAYPTAFETLSRGKTLGKLAMGIRVVSDDGSPERFRQALIRALAAAFIEIWLLPFNLIGMPAGLITSMVSARGKRLGDVFAGTFVIQERVPKRSDLTPEFAMIAPPLMGWAPHLEISTLPDQVAATVSSYLRRYRELRPAARTQIGAQLAASVSRFVSPPPPPGTPPEAFLAAVLAVRRQREQARIYQQQAARHQHEAPQHQPPQPPQPQPPQTQPPQPPQLPQPPQTQPPQPQPPQPQPPQPPQPQPPQLPQNQAYGQPRNGGGPSGTIPYGPHLGGSDPMAAWPADARPPDPCLADPCLADPWPTDPRPANAVPTDPMPPAQTPPDTFGFTAPV
ncbi:MAG TPA: RDD family protein [Streptosporangiaceae bacterium]|nr:RDD family protein [Streptosporangiaceae bacterium]